MYRKLLNFFEGEGNPGDGGAPSAGETAQLANGQMDGQTEPTQEDLDAEFEALIKGKYKSQYDKRFQESFDRRHKDYKQTQETLKGMEPMLDMLRQKYGVKDLKDLQKAIVEDDSYYETEAAERGISVEQLKYMKQIERENAKFRQQQEESRQQEAAREKVNRWIQQEAGMKNQYPAFSLRAELQNPDFEQLLLSGVDVETAYKVTHMDEIMGGAMNYTAKKAVEKTVKGIQARGNRPDEAGIAPARGNPGKKSVSDMSGDEIMDIAKRVMNGETITL